MLPPSRPLDPARTEAPPRDRTEPRPPATLLPRTIKLCLALGLAALGATQYLSRAVESGTLRQLVARAEAIDPETTGSLGGAADRVTLDPCTATGLRR